MSDKFEYKYVAPTLEEQKEINRIRNQYLPKNKTMTKFERLQYLDNKIKSVSTSAGISLGVIGLLMFGTGLTFFLEWIKFWYFGIPFSVIGIFLISIANLVYNKVKKKYTDKYSDEIIQLSNELLGENKSDLK